MLTYSWTGLSGSQYNTALTVFFFPYAFLEVPSNIALKLLRPSIWICIMMASWDLVSTNKAHIMVRDLLLVPDYDAGTC